MAKGKKTKSNSYTSKGQRSNVSKIGKRKSSDVSYLERTMNKMSAFKSGKNVYLTIPNPNTNETNKKFLRVKASEVWTKTGSKSSN